MSDDMRNLFFIMKGQYRKGVAPSFVNKVSNEVSWVGGYDPNSDDTEEWYQALDCKTYHCVACGSDLDRVLKGVYNTIVTHGGVTKRYFKHVSDTTSDDYYEVHYLGKAPLTHEQRVKKAEGRCPRVSPVMRCLYEQVFSEYGEHFREDIKVMEEKAYDTIEERRPHNKTKKLVSKVKTNEGGVVKTQTTREEVITTPTLKKVTPKLKFSVKKV